MIIIYKNRGILIPVYLVVSLIGVKILDSVITKYLGGIFAADYDFQIVMGIGFLISSVWTYLTSEDYEIVNGVKEKMYMNNHFFYISMKLWSYLMFGFGVLIVISGIVETIN
ncbi:hypothetical protein [uncultured Aquimarina sp.]|uniref:hypothetical protein n=1 Tax=uncultured Aquimarina sp. TaxID=575652 RepID=UPI002612392E|nr:hypothetical protein [uncultured Aquimarina sp.]